MSTEITSSISKNRRIVNEALVESKDRIFHFLLRHTRNEQDAQDVLQDFFVRVLTRADDLQSCEKIRGWLSSILRSNEDIERDWFVTQYTSCEIVPIAEGLGP